MSSPAAFTAIVVEKILRFLAPLFADECANDPAAARQAARETLASYGARNNHELRLAALAIAFGFGALDALCRASAPNLALNQVLRLRGNANALNRAANQTETKLEKLRRQFPSAAEGDPEPANDALPATAATPDLLAFTRSATKAELAARPVATPTVATPAFATATVATPTIAASTVATPTVDTLTFATPAIATPTVAAPTLAAPLSRQQRRAAERSAEKLRRQQQAAAEKLRRAAGAERASTFAAAPTGAQPIKAIAAT